MGVTLAKAPAGGAGERRRRRRRRRSQPMAEINVTPFVDVMLVLLIIFMVAAPLLTVGVDIDMPETAASALPTDDEEPLTVTVLADGSLAIQETPVADADLVPRLQGIAAERESSRIYVRADRANSWDRVASVMGALNAAGFTDIGLVTDTGGEGLGGGDGAADGGE